MFCFGICLNLGNGRGDDRFCAFYLFLCVLCLYFGFVCLILGLQKCLFEYAAALFDGIDYLFFAMDIFGDIVKCSDQCF